MTSKIEIQNSIHNSYSTIVNECRTVLGSELHYQAMVYSILRTKGKVPISQIGMNVKTCIENCQTEFLQERIRKKNIKFQSIDLEIIPDISVYEKSINSDWRRRNFKNTLKKTLYSLEIKASERHYNRLVFSEIKNDLFKLKAQYEETKIKFGKLIGIGMLIIDTAPKCEERISKSTLKQSIDIAKELNIDIWYFNQDEVIEYLAKY
ncbi:hypothetical protein [Formosa algae]|uniref:Nucleic acid-binding Zn ribbon protein n=1 Tax=Formosa algae TaxID=225843 RepID=A0A9X0YKG8_9FLAO|nr:hypothetical protein [Formosa algae]MBP1840442.1 putative nucleic acid-binding Zn ribbon protein [Formosa algae]MDQ0336934.1 putative nucleic acid-binding Zn ribbon protein [Formosa algae]OEI80823.1 hypothetical protein AST99_07155 [Formosa algae]